VYINKAGRKNNMTKLETFGMNPAQYAEYLTRLSNEPVRRMPHTTEMLDPEKEKSPLAIWLKEHGVKIKGASRVYEDPTVEVSRTYYLEGKENQKPTDFIKVIEGLTGLKGTPNKRPEWAGSSNFPEIAIPVNKDWKPPVSSESKGAEVVTIFSPRKTQQKIGA
jgi:hypothetical protein